MTRSLQTCGLFLLCVWWLAGCSPAKIKPKVQKGLLDLSSYNFSKSGTVELNGEWEFYWKKLYTHQDILQQKPAKKSYIFSPRTWNSYEHKQKAVGGIGYATYHLRVKLPKKNLKLALKILPIGTTYRLYINDQLQGSGGKLSTEKTAAVPGYNPTTALFNPTSSMLYITIQVANHHYLFGGIWQTIHLGLQDQVFKKKEREIMTDFFLAGSIFIIALYHIGLFFIRRKSASALYFSMVCITAAVRLLFTGEYMIQAFIQLDWFTLIRTDYLTITLGPLAFGWFLHSLFSKEYARKLLLVQTFMFSVSFLIILLSPPSFFASLLSFFQVLVLLSCAYAMFVLIKATIHKQEGAFLFVIGALALFVTITNDILYTAEIINTDHQFGAGLFIFIFFQALVLSFRFSKAFSQTEELSEQLNYTNKNLEKRVEERTGELQMTNQRLNEFVEELDTINTELSTKNDLIVKKNKNITDSISYASNIQKALLPLNDDISRAFSEYFIFYQPRDIVSGDFYWFTQISNSTTQKVEKTIFATVDCTGHGVPGAFMSMLGIESLNSIVNQQNITEPQQILTSLHEHISQILRHHLNDIRDGMDLALCMIDHTQKNLTFAGAHNPLILIQNNELKLLKGSSLSIGSMVKNRAFTQRTLPLEASNWVYMFTDGFQDQFGGPEKRKFMKKQLQELLFTIHQKPMKEQKLKLQQTLDHWMTEGNEKQIDDILVVGFKLNF